jgi:hypothetical protein
MDRRKDITQQDWVLVCVDCGQQFVFTTEEQAFYQSKQLSIPKRCKPCRKARRQSIVPDERARHD